MAITKLVITGNTTAVGISSTPITVAVINPAGAVSVKPESNITETNVQAALEQLDDIKAPIDNPTFTGDVNLGTNSKAVFGDFDNLEIYSDGTHSYIDEVGSGALYIKASTLQMVSPNDELLFVAQENAGAYLYYDNVSKIGTTADGVSIHGDLVVDSNTLYVNSTTNRVGINTETPDYDLEISGSAQIAGGDFILRSDSNDADTQSIRFENAGDDSRSAYIRADYDTNSSGNAISLVLGTNPSTNDGSDRVTITDTGTVLIGKSELNFGNTVDHDGHAINKDAFHQQSNERSCASFNRRGNAGAILDFYQDAGIVGNIGTFASDLTIGTTDVGVRFDDNASAYIPWNTNSNSATDATIDLGASTARYKDLYLSGGVNFGGAVNSNGNVSSSNTLDDYEEGTWTPVLHGQAAPFADATFTLEDAHYTKIGNICHAHMEISNVSKGSMNGNVVIEGFPFSNAGKMQNVFFTHTDIFTFDEIDRTVSGFLLASKLYLKKGISTSNVLASDLTSNTNGNLIMSITYMTS